MTTTATLQQVKLALLNRLVFAQDPAVVEKMKAAAKKALGAPYSK